MEELKGTSQSKRGYLDRDFLFFHLKDKKTEQFEYHYHSFYKIVFFISGRVVYHIEGKSYRLKPWDILLISDRDIHRAAIDMNETYERIVIWFSPGFLMKNSSPENSLLTCFDKASDLKQNLLRTDPDTLKQIKQGLISLEKAVCSGSFAADTEKNALFLLLAVQLNRIFLQSPADMNTVSKDYDETIEKIISHIDENLGSSLTVEELAEKFYLSRYALMHKFKKNTGFTLHSFILQKRLILAGRLIRNGTPAMTACYECGFTDYSAFNRAFRRFYGVSPGKYVKKVYPPYRKHTPD